MLAAWALVCAAAAKLAVVTFKTRTKRHRNKSDLMSGILYELFSN